MATTTTAETGTHSPALLAAATAATAAALTMAYQTMMVSMTNNSSAKAQQTPPLPAFLTDAKHHEVVKLLHEHLDHLSGDALIKIVRQLDFWTQEDDDNKNLLALTTRLIHAATWQQRHDFRVPTVRYGRTELKMPLVTCGAMRFQATWLPDSMPISMRKETVLQSPSQDNMLDVVRQCLKLGINHFETARFYGTSEVQLSHALHTLVESGEIQRSDFIMQTKVFLQPTLEDFKKRLDESWAHMEKFGYIDLFSFHCVSKDAQVDEVLDDAPDGVYAHVMEWKKLGRIRNVGFSTHGTAENIMRLIESNKFDYINLHYHYFGSYHAEGTPDTKGGHGNLACVKRALEIDMGVFNISPIDKGGHLYMPSQKVARTIGPELTPIAFAALHSWVTADMHTVSIGLARPEDLCEIVEAVELYNNPAKMKPLLEGAVERLDRLALDALGQEWCDKGLLHVPGPFAKEADGIGLGHMLWCYNLLEAYGMYDMAKARHGSLVTATKRWNKKKSFEENIQKAIDNANPMRGIDDADDLKPALIDHMDPGLAEERIRRVHKLLATKAPMSRAERKKLGLEEAYDLRPWHEFPDSTRVTAMGVVLQNVSGGWLGCGGGPTTESKDLGVRIRECIAKQVKPI